MGQTSLHVGNARQENRVVQGVVKCQENVFVPVVNRQLYGDNYFSGMATIRIPGSRRLKNVG